MHQCSHPGKIRKLYNHFKAGILAVFTFAMKDDAGQPTTTMESQQVRRSTPRQTAQITFSDGETYEGAVGTSLETFLRAAYPDPEAPLIAALVNGTLRELTYAIKYDCHVKPIDLSDSDGVRIYRRSLSFLLVVAAHTLFP